MSDIEIPDGYKADPRGALVPIDMIKPERLEEDALVIELTKRAKELNSLLAEFKAKTLGDVDAMLALIDEKYDAKKGGKKGNVTLTSFDGTLQIHVAVGESIAFGPELNSAKELIDSCVLRWSENSGSEIQVLVQHAFQTNKQGKIDTGRVLGLRNLDIKDEEWLRAMEAIADAVRVTGSKTYARFYERDPKTEDKTPISLDLAKA